MKNKNVFLCLLFSLFSVSSINGSSAPTQSTQNLENFGIIPTALIIKKFTLPYSEKEINSLLNDHQVKISQALKNLETDLIDQLPESTPNISQDIESIQIQIQKNIKKMQEDRQKDNENAQKQYLDNLINTTAQLVSNEFDNPDNNSYQEILRNYLYSIVTTLGESAIAEIKAEEFDVNTLTQKLIAKKNDFLLGQFNKQVLAKLRKKDGQGDDKCPRAAIYSTTIGKIEDFIKLDKKQAEQWNKQTDKDKQYEQQMKITQKMNFIVSAVQQPLLMMGINQVGTLLGSGLSSVLSKEKQEKEIAALKQEIQDTKMKTKEILLAAKEKCDKYNNKPTKKDFSEIFQDL